MAGGIYLGSFAGGLFSGAQSIFSLYKEYQGVRRQVKLDEYDEQRRLAREEDEKKRLAGTGASKVPGTQDFTRAPGTTALPAPTPAPTPTAAPEAKPDILTRPPEPAYPPAPLTEGDIAPSFRGQNRSAAGTENDPWITGGGYPRTPMVGGVPRALYPWDPYNPVGTQTLHPQETSQADVDRALAEHQARRAMARDPAYGPTQPQPTGPAQMPDRAALGYARQFNAPSPGVQSDVDAHGAVPDPTRTPPWPMTPTNRPVGATVGAGGGPSAITNQPVGASLQPVPAPPSVMAPTNEPIPSRQPGGPYTPPPQQDPRVPSYTMPQPAVPPADVAQPYQPPPPVMAPGTEPIPSRQPGGFISPPQQQDPRGLPPPQPYSPAQATPPTSVPPPAPSPATPMGGASSLGGRILSMINPMGSAQAAEITPARPVGQGDPNAPAPTPTQSAYGQPPAPAPAQPTGITPAQPPTVDKNPPTHPPPAPVAVAGTGGKVLQSEGTPPALAPPVDMSHYNNTKTRYPERLAMVERAIAAEGAQGIVSPEFMLATIGRENAGWNNAISHGTSAAGYTSSAKGLVQIIDGTRRSIDPRGELDWRDPEQNIRLGVRLYKTQALDQGLGSDTLQNAMVYRGGYDFLNGVAKHGFDGYAAQGPEQKSQVVDMMKMFPGSKLADIPITAVSGNHKNYDAVALYQRAQAEGPDGLLRGLVETGPAGLGMSDRWRAAQSALESYLIISGHPEQAGMAGEWVAQMSQQGTVSNLIAADQAIMSKDPQTAIGYLAKAHAFFPDGTYARFGADNKGNIWAYRLSDRNGTPVGQPFQVTHEDIAKQIIGLQNPVTYVKTLQAHQKENAKMELDRAHTEYYKQLPGIKEEQVRAGIEKEHLRQQGIRERTEQAERHQQETAALRAERNTALEADVEKAYPPSERPKDAPEGEYERAADIYRQIRKVPSQGGGDMSQASAKMYADGLAAGKYDLALMATQPGKPPVYAVRDKQGKNVGTAPLSYEQGELIKPLLGLAGSAPLQGAPNVAPPVPSPAPALTPAKPPPPMNTNAPSVPLTDPMGNMSALPRQGLSRAA
jgi:hypothetical protein